MNGLELPKHLFTYNNTDSVFIKLMRFVYCCILLFIMAWANQSLPQMRYKLGGISQLDQLLPIEETSYNDMSQTICSQKLLGCTSNFLSFQAHIV